MPLGPRSVAHSCATSAKPALSAAACTASRTTTSSGSTGAAAAADLAGWVQHLTRRVLDQDRRIAELTAEIERLKREADTNGNGERG